MLSKATIKDIQSLQHKKFRDETSSFIAEGPKVVKELLLDGGFNCKVVYALQKWIENTNQGILDLLKDKLQVIEEFELEKIASYSTPNGVLAIFEKRISNAVFGIKNECTLVLDAIQDPGNMGTIIRTADWFGIKNIVCSLNTVDIYNSKVVQSTMASLARVNVIYTDLESWLKNNHQVKILATTLSGSPLKNFKGLKESIVLIGNEANGLSDELMQLADEKITIPKFGGAESLNAAVATAIVLYELRS